MAEHGHHHEHHMTDVVADHPDEGHPHTIGKFVAVFVALCVLTGASFLTYFPWWREHVSIEASRALMMAVSCTKAMLVIMFFMHLLWEANWKWVLTIPATCMSIFLLLMLIPDIGMRQNNGFARYSRDRLLWAAEPPQVLQSQTELLEEEESHEAAPRHEQGTGGGH